MILQRNRSQQALNKTAARRQAAEIQVHASATRQQRTAISAFYDREQQRAEAKAKARQEPQLAQAARAAAEAKTRQKAQLAAVARAERKAQKAADRALRDAQRAAKRTIKQQKAVAKAIRVRIRNAQRQQQHLPPLAHSIDRTATFPLAQPITPPPALPDDDMASVGPVVIPRVQAAALAQLQSRSPTAGTRIVYSDRSLTDSGTKDIAMAFGAVDTSQDTTATLQGRVDGYASSTKAELMGLIATVIMQPKEQDLL
ncbi:hypothetical protein EDD11_003628, partial [Mortierella claussenii]